MAAASVSIAVASKAVAAGRDAGAYLDVRRDFGAQGNGDRDDTRALQAAIRLGAEQHRPIVVPPGTYKITQPLQLPSNSMLLGAAPGLGFGCRIEPHGCPALTIGGDQMSFHCYIENLMIWPRGPAPSHLISIDNSYSVTLRNLRIHNAQERLGSAAIKLLGDKKSGGHGRCNGILWENLIVRNDTDQPRIAIHAAPGCGSHRFIVPCLENYETLIEWNGGQLDIFAPYTERAGRYGINCDVDPTDVGAYLNTFGGFISNAESGVALALRSNSGVFNSFGTVWGEHATRACYVYEVPAIPPLFHGIVPNLTARGKSRFSGVDGWMRSVRFSNDRLRATQRWEATIAPGGAARTSVRLAGVVPGQHWARAMLNADCRGAQLDAFVSGVDEVIVSARNEGKERIAIGGQLTVECGAG